MGSVAAYLKEGDWNRLFQKYQYDIILTAAGGDVIYCSNSSFTSGSTVNKYRPRESNFGVWKNFSTNRSKVIYLQN